MSLEEAVMVVYFSEVPHTIMLTTFHTIFKPYISRFRSNRLYHRPPFLLCLRCILHLVPLSCI